MRLRCALGAVCAAVVAPHVVVAQRILSLRDSAILAAPFADVLGVNTATMRLLAPAVFVDDLKRGIDPEAVRGQVVLVRSEVWRTDGTRVLSSTCQSLQFRIGTGTVITGVETAARGMQPGGTRLMVLGSEQGYGTRGVDGEVPPDATLVVRLQLIEISDKQFPNPNECVRS